VPSLNEGVQRCEACRRKVTPSTPLPGSMEFGVVPGALVKVFAEEEMGMSESVGLCASCKRARLIRSDRDSVFYLCTLSEVSQFANAFTGIAFYDPSTADARIASKGPQRWRMRWATFSTGIRATELRAMA
jgi:hypothetical protein